MVVPRRKSGSGYNPTELKLYPQTAFKDLKGYELIIVTKQKQVRS